MVEINVPGDEIDAAARNIQRVIDLFDSTSTDVPSLQQALGNDPLVSDAAEDFKSRWDDGRTQLRDEGADIIEALKQVLQSFTDTDNQLGDGLTATGPAPPPTPEQLAAEQRSRENQEKLAAGPTTEEAQMAFERAFVGALGGAATAIEAMNELYGGAEGAGAPAEGAPRTASVGGGGGTPDDGTATATVGGDATPAREERAPAGEPTFTGTVGEESGPLPIRTKAAPPRDPTIPTPESS